MMTYKQTLDFLYSQLPMYQRDGASAYKKDLTNIKALCSGIGDPHDQLKCIHVAGTNGKGTVSHLMAYFLQSQGYKVGLYTSPHYMDFRERIKVNGVPMDKGSVVGFVNDNIELIETVKPSFFEITVAMAFNYFREQQVDFAIIEVGLGGRLDSTNIIHPILSIITNISFDHTDMLGDTLVQIAGEKAGIIKYEVPVIIGEYQEEVDHVFVSKAGAMQAPLTHARDVIISQDDTYIMPSGHKLKLSKGLEGPFQHKNILTACAALYILSCKMPIDLDKIQASFGKFRQMTYYMGRWQILQQSPKLIVDSAHNEGGIKYLNEMFDKVKGKKHLVLGFAKDKDLDKILPLFPKDAKYYWAKANIPRGMIAESLQAKGASHGLNGRAYRSVRQACAAARMSASQDDLIFVGGSIFVVAEVLPLYKSTQS